MKSGTGGAIKMLRKERNQVDKPWTTKIQSGSLGENPLDLKDMHKGFSKMPPGSRGEMEISWKMGGLHSVAWENVHGNVVVFDTQNGRQYKNKKEINEMAKTLNGAGITRLDNKPLNNDYLMRWVKDAN
jgi:hypothetical protein